MIMETPVIANTGRLEAYSDAIFSIIATVMIIPIAHTELPEDEPLKHTFVSLLLPRIGVYIYTFLVITYFWSSHVWLFESLQTVDEVVTLLNLGLMMVITFLPFTFTLLGFYLLDSLAVALFCSAIILLGVIQLILIGYVFYNSERLEPELRDNPKIQRNRMCFRIAMPVLLAGLGLILSYIWVLGALILVFSTIFSNYFRSKIVYVYCKLRGLPVSDFDDNFATPLTKKIMFETVSKERVECFSDGVFAIVATIIILDICESYIPDHDEVKAAGSLAAALYRYWRTYLAYAGTFLTVGLQWYVHHSLIHYLKDVSKLMVFFNNMCLLFIGLTPLSFTLISNFEVHMYDTNETMAIQLNCLTIFFAGIFQLSVWVTALYNQSLYVIEDGAFHGIEHYYICAKLLVYPIVSLTMFFITFTPSTIRVVAFSLMEIGVCLTFLIIIISYPRFKVFVRKNRGPLQPQSPYDELNESVSSVVS